jgi:glycosyltransferase involved in cell wall biosynthesis
MDICHLTINPIDYERRINNQAESSKRANHTVWILALGKPGETSTFKKNKIPVRRIITAFHRGGPLKFIHFNMKVFLYLIPKHLDILHCHDLWVLPCAYLLRIFKKFSVIYDAHEYYEGLEIFNRNKIRKKIWMLAERIAIKKVNYLITVSEPIARLYIQKYPGLTNIEVIRNVAKRETNLASKKSDKFPETEKKIVVFQGMFRPGRGLIQLIEAMTILDGVHLLLIGGGELEGKIREKIIALNLQNKISLIGYVPLDQLIATTSGADLGVALFEKTSLNYSYALPNKFFEYIMAGIPVLASDLETIEEYIKTYEIGLTVNPQNVQEIANAIQQMLSDEDRLYKWRENTVIASRILNWENESQKLNKIYEKIQV